ncbi:MAG: hypothetical protein KKG47_08635 [Proteobacteria bacterium]|nr:hypothetical protein [Pseudomonadota bacterium]MBU1736769.1 hypothetical protein [Pseudomonadota bacterium]
MHRRALRKKGGWTSFRFFGSGAGGVLGGGIKFPESPIPYGLLSVFLITALTLIFYYRFQTGLWLVAAAAPLSFIPGAGAFYFERHLLKLQDRLERDTGRLQAGFLVLFAFLIGFIVFYTILFTYPMGLLIGSYADEMIRDQYGRWVINLVIAVSLASWLRWQIVLKWR